MFAAAIHPEDNADHHDWRSELGTDLRVQQSKYRFSRVYTAIPSRLSAAPDGVTGRTVRLSVFSTESGPIATAGVVGVSSEEVIAVVAIAYTGGAIMAWPRERKATGEMYDRDKEVDWKPLGFRCYPRRLAAQPVERTYVISPRIYVTDAR